MSVFVTDEMITKCHALFENGQVREGYILFLDQHLDRLFKGIKECKIQNVPYSREEIKEIITKLVAMSGSRNCSFRYFLSTGLDGRHAQFYCIVEEGIPKKPLEGCKE